MPLMVNSQKKKICVLSGRYPPSVFESHINHAIYCDINNYTYIYCNWPTRAKNRYMNKIEYIKTYYNFFDYIFWIDDDAFFIDMDKKLEEFLPVEKNFLSICRSPDYKKIHTYISSGQFMLKCSEKGRKFIDRVNTVDLLEVKNWWSDSLGYFSNGDQDAMVYLLLEDFNFNDMYKIYHHSKFNSRAEEIFKEGDYRNIFILHFTGTPERKKEDYIKIQKFLDRPPSLVEEATIKKYNLATKKRNLFVKLWCSIKHLTVQAPL